MVYWSVEPFGSPVDDQRFEQLVALLFQANTAANTATPTFFDRRDADEIARDDFHARSRNADTLAERIASYFEGRIAKQPSEGDENIKDMTGE